MPGIVGIITSKPREEAAAELRQMIASMRHEPFYETGAWMDTELGVYAGWVEFADAAHGPAPQVSETGDKVLVFSGNEFPEPGTAQRLREQGHQVVEGSLAHLVHVAEEDASFPAGLNGQFHGLLVDRRQRTATLFNDRYASRRLYIHEARDGFYFAAEAKALLAVKPELRRACERGLGEFISCGCVLEDRTLFKGIGILPWAAAWTFRNGVLESRGQFFSPGEWEDQEPLETEAFYRAVRDGIAFRLLRYFPAGERIGMSLTGGLDTRVIMAWLRPEQGTLPCYTFSGPYQECRDVRIARRVANLCGQSYRAIPIDGAFLKDFPRLAEKTVFVTDGYADVRRSPGLYANRVAREIAPVRMTGNFGDEMMRRWVVFHPSTPPDGVFTQDFLAHAAAAGATYERSIATLKPARAAIRQISWSFHGIQAMEQTQIESRTPFLDNQLIQAVFRAQGTVLPINDLRVRLIFEGNPKLGRIRTDLGFAGWGGKPATAFWHFVQRATMRAEYAFENANPAWLAQFDRKVLGSRMEKTFVGVHKFVHFARWYREDLAGYVREMLLDPRTLKRPYLNAQAVERAVESHVRGESNQTPVIHSLLTLEHFHRLFVDAK